MASRTSPRLYKCEKCLIIDDQLHAKILVCGNAVCSVSLHYNCRMYKPVELKVLENNKLNVKWYCLQCTDTSTLIT